MKNIWCVLARDGIWCATKAQRCEPDIVNAVPTLCGMVVVLPWDLQKRQPTCVVCRRRLSEKEKGR
jgi:hypothetical protein